ncbi:chaperone NapD [Lutibacter sp.]|uniref:chaperone NapD n=1 Tax=Lutibacter sp. TaxID=1925666 RepID=UPI002735E304|nr:chaperone NapD [Lutibacter sp.]MDP3312538.1 chaperone NapD [Lutibacter sp.]
MPIKSYILHFEEGKKEIVLKELHNLQNCEVIPAQNQNVLVVVTATDTEELDNNIYNQILEIEGLKHLSLVSGFDTN